MFVSCRQYARLKNRKRTEPDRYRSCTYPPKDGSETGADQGAVYGQRQSLVSTARHLNQLEHIFEGEPDFLRLHDPSQNLYVIHERYTDSSLLGVRLLLHY